MCHSSEKRYKTAKVVIVCDYDLYRTEIIWKSSAVLTTQWAVGYAD